MLQELMNNSTKFVYGYAVVFFKNIFVINNLAKVFLTGLFVMYPIHSRNVDVRIKQKSLSDRNGSKQNSENFKMKQ